MSRNNTAKEYLSEAMLVLMSRCSLAEITVTEICKKAGVSRASFYRNFESVFELFSYIVEKASREAFAAIMPLIEGNNPDGWRQYAYQMFKRRIDGTSPYVNLMMVNKFELDNRLVIRIEELVKKNLARTTSNEEAYIFMAKLGALRGIGSEWSKRGFYESPEEITKTAMRIINSF